MLLNAILEDLWQRIPPACRPGQDEYWDAVGFWLARIPDPDQYRWWVIRFTTTIHLRWNLHPTFAAFCIEGAVVKAAQEQERRRP